jgi:peptidoglycan/xylan/chitin deacetylase (PgdA/CDA1 family)
VIRLDLEGSPTSAERWAFELLVDLSRLLPTDPASQGGVRAKLIDTAPSEPDFAPSDQEVRVNRATLRRVVELAGARAEQISTERDRHGRVPPTVNASVKGGTDRELPVHRLAEALFEAVKLANRGQPLYRLAGWPDQRSWAAAFTHDLDVVKGWPIFATLRWMELLKKGELGRAGAAIGSGISAIGSNPVGTAVAAILGLEKNAGIKATWFVIAGEPTFASRRRGDITYRLDSPAGRRIIQQLLGAGHEIGLHASFETRDHPDLMARERARVTRAVGKAPAGVRQHFLRFDPGKTPAGAEKAGFTYDATFGFPDRNGFRLGVADVIPVWQESPAGALSLLEAPLCWMDRTHSKYRGEENPDTWVDDALELADTCREAGGLWTGLWHPNVVPALGFPGALEALARLIQQIVSREPYIAPLGEIVAWRAARRALRGRLNAAGGVALVSDRNGHWSVTLEDITAGGSSVHPWPPVSRG